MKFIYFGSAKFSRIVLEILYHKGYKPSLVVSQPDKLQGRGLKLLPTEVSLFAAEKEIPLIKPASLNTLSVIQELSAPAVDFFIVADYGKLLPAEILSIPKIFALGVHPSLLPRYRGSAPVNWALIRGDKQTGVTVFKVAEKMDAGPVILSKEASVDDNDNAVSLRDKLAQIGGEVLIAALDKILSGSYCLTPQDEAEVSFAGKLTKKNGCINWDSSVYDIRNLICGVWGWPSAYTYYRNKVIKIIETEVYDSKDCCQSPGTIIQLDKEGIYVAAACGVLKIKVLKPEGRKQMSANAFICGYRIKVGDKFNI